MTLMYLGATLVTQAYAVSSFFYTAVGLLALCQIMWCPLASPPGWPPRFGTAEAILISLQTSGKRPHQTITATYRGRSSAPGQAASHAVAPRMTASRGGPALAAQACRSLDP